SADNDEHLSSASPRVLSSRLSVPPTPTIENREREAQPSLSRTENARRSRALYNSPPNVAFHVSRSDSRPPEFLGRARLHDRDAARHRSRSGHDASGDFSARARPGAVEGRVRAAVASPRR